MNSLFTNTCARVGTGMVGEQQQPSAAREPEEYLKTTVDDCALDTHRASVWPVQLARQLLTIR